MNPIDTAAEHQTALEELEALMISEPAPDSAESERIQQLGCLIEAYEKVHHSVDAPPPISTP